MKKIVGILVCMLLITTAVLTVIVSGAVNKIKSSNYELNNEIGKPIMFICYENGDVLDQNQSDYCGWGWVVWGPDFRLAQSFKPTLNLISRVELLLYLVGTPGKLEISIRSELSGPDLTSIIVDGTNISGFEEHWAEFDFPDIGMEPEQTYYIIWSTIDSDSTNYFVWGYGDHNPYDRGDAYTYSPDDGWRINEGTPDHPDIDFCFKTYGRDNQPPNFLTISGTVTGIPDVTYDYDFTNCVDPEGDDMTYHVEWGDGGMDEGFVESDGAFTLSHTWTKRGDYVIKAKLVDDYGAEGDWTTIDVSIPRTRALHNYDWLSILEQFPFIRQIIDLMG
jgi:hypothetical protein